MQILARILTEHGPLGEHDVAEQLRDAGVEDWEDVVDDLHDEIVCPARQLVDERWVWLPAVLDGRVFTHRVGADEVAHDMLHVQCDLTPITELCEYGEDQRFADGSAARVAVADYDDDLLEERDIPADLLHDAGALLLTPGALAKLRVRVGDLVGLRLTARGMVVERVAAPAPGSAAGAVMKSMVDDADEPLFFEQAVWTACVKDPTVFTDPLPPLREIIDESALALDVNSLAPQGFDFDAWRFDLNCKMLAELHDLDPDDAAALYALIKMYEQMWAVLAAADDEPQEDDEDADAPEPTPFSDLMGEIGGVLADPELAQLFLERTASTERGGAAALGLFAETMEPKVPRAARVAYRWLRALALERIGDIEDAERELLAAEAMNPDWPLTLFDLARFASDRGDVERGLSLLHRAGAPPDHHLVELLEQHRTTPRSDLGRNELCWCGSGRKYKKCHLGREQLPLADRVDWLLAKAVDHALGSGWKELVAEVGYERCRYADDDPDAFAAALADPLVMDAVLFEGGAFADFVEVRGSLLPDDERLLAEGWLQIQRSLFEVEEVRAGQGLTVRDVRTGDMQEVHERTASRQLKSGQLICARVVPVGATTQIVGGIEPVALHERNALIELLDTGPDPVTLVAWLTRRFAPPTLTNTEGDPLAICEATVRVGPGVEAALDDTYDREDSDPSRWLEHVVTDGMPRIRATLTLDGDTLRVQTNSEKRMDRVLATLARVDPEMDVLDDSRVAVPTARGAAELAKRMPHAGENALDPNDPQVAAALAEYIREYEAKWVDEPIPALDGHTPRQAADDPTRRKDLIKLLATFPAGDAPGGGMDADRLRAALGLR